MNEQQKSSERFENQRAALANRLKAAVTRAIEFRQQRETFARELEDLESLARNFDRSVFSSEELARQIGAKRSEKAMAQNAAKNADREITNLEESLRKLMQKLMGK
jgi:chromosome segregation ATPase